MYAQSTYPRVRQTKKLGKLERAPLVPTLYLTHPLASYESPRASWDRSLYRQRQIDSTLDARDPRRFASASQALGTGVAGWGRLPAPRHTLRQLGLGEFALAKNSG